MKKKKPLKIKMKKILKYKRKKIRRNKGQQGYVILSRTRYNTLSKKIALMKISYPNTKFICPQLPKKMNQIITKRPSKIRCDARPWKKSLKPQKNKTRAIIPLPKDKKIHRM
jgi:hypothetical protein